MAEVALIAVGGPFLLSLVATLWVRRWARRTAFVDRPGGHKQHHRPVALGGGIALMAAIWLPILAAAAAAWFLVRAGVAPDWLPAIVHTHMEGVASKAPTLLAILGGAIVLHVTGLIDDRRPLGPGVKFLVQFAVAFYIAGPVGIRAVEALPPVVSMIGTAFWIVLIVNAFNFLDNMDGLSAGVAAIAAAIFGLSAMSVGQVFVPAVAWVLAGALAGFLVFNFSPATIFMGDAGSLVVGYMLAVLTILTTYYDPSQHLTPLGIAVPIVVLAVPLYDVGSVIVHRRRAGQSPFRGDRRHFSHRLVRRGLSTRKAVLTIYLATAATGLPAIILPRVEWTTAVLLLLQCACVVAIIAILEHSGGRGEPGANP
ncbi:MAG: MraY family glycosyltransferase [Planctomycetota bacterium]|mgnify:FL=1